MTMVSGFVGFVADTHNDYGQEQNEFVIRRVGVF